jgi:hypothetical protein
MADANAVAEAPNKNADAQETDQQKQVREQQEADGNDIAETQEKASAAFEKIEADAAKFIGQFALNSMQRSQFATRLHGIVTGATRVAAAAKVRTPVVELPADKGSADAVKVKPVAHVMAGIKEPSGTSLPTANPNPKPGENK